MCDAEVKAVTEPEEQPDFFDGQSDEDMAVAEDNLEQELPGFKAWLSSTWPIGHDMVSPKVSQTYGIWLENTLIAQKDSNLYNLFDMTVSVGCDAGWRSVSMASLIHKVEMYVQDR